MLIVGRAKTQIMRVHYNAGVFLELLIPQSWMDNSIFERSLR